MDATIRARGSLITLPPTTTKTTEPLNHETHIQDCARCGVISCAPRKPRNFVCAAALFASIYIYMKFFVIFFGERKKTHCKYIIHMYVYTCKCHNLQWLVNSDDYITHKAIKIESYVRRAQRRKILVYIRWHTKMAHFKVHTIRIHLNYSISSPPHSAGKNTKKIALLARHTLARRVNNTQTRTIYTRK